MTKIICAILLSSLVLVSCEQVKIDKDKERINSICDKFMQNFRDGKISEAIQQLKQNSVITNSTLDTLQITIQKQMNNILSGYGKILSYEFITERKIKDIVAKRLYILKFEKYYLKFDFIVYKSAAGWTITNFNYNEDLIELLY